MGKEKEKIVLGAEGVYDARKLGVPKMLVLGFQHTFAHPHGYQCVYGSAVCGLGHAAVPPYHKREGACVSRFQLCVSGRLCCGCAAWR